MRAIKVGSKPISKVLFLEVCITCPKRYAEKGYIRETAQTPSAKTLGATQADILLDKMKLMKYIIQCLLIIALTSCSGDNDSESKILGKWKITNCIYFKANDNIGGLKSDYYKLNIGRVVEYRADMQAEWIAVGKPFPYSLNLKDSLIQFEKKSIRLIKLTSTELIIRENTEDSASVTTYFVKVE